jgi:hypothetical protein
MYISNWHHLLLFLVLELLSLCMLGMGQIPQIIYQDPNRTYLFDLTLNPTESIDHSLNYTSMDYSGIYTDLLNTAASYSDIAKDSVIIINTTQEAIDEVTKAAVYAEMGHYWPWKENAQDAIITSDIVQKYNLDKTDLASRPNIVYMLIDDLGWNDVNLIKESTFIPWGTPNIDILRDEGIVLTNYYAENQCTPSRASLMTGKYGLRIGQDISETDYMKTLSQTSTFSTSEVTLAQELKSAGYNTIGVGKWGLGFDEFAGIPTQSGFDHFYGYWNAMLDHRYKQVNAGADVEGLVNTIDFWDDELWLGEDVRVSSTADEDLIAYLISEKVDEYIEEYAQEDKHNRYLQYRYYDYIYCSTTKNYLNDSIINSSIIIWCL